MKKLMHTIYCTVINYSNPVTNLETGCKEIAIRTELFGFIIKRTYKAV